MFLKVDLNISTISWSTSYSSRSSAVILASPSTSPSNSALAFVASRGEAKVTRAWEGAKGRRLSCTIWCMINN